MRTSPLLWGFLSSGFRAKLFLSLWWSVRSWLLSFPPNACRGERCGVWGSIAPSDWVLVVASGAFPLRLPGALFFSSGNLLSASAPTKGDRRPHHDLFGSGRGTSTLNLQIEFFGRAQRRCRGCAVPKGFPTWARKFFFSVKVPPSMSVFQLSRTLETSPSSWACTRPVAIRQRSTAS